MDPVLEVRLLYGTNVRMMIKLAVGFFLDKTSYEVKERKAGDGGYWAAATPTTFRCSDHSLPEVL